MARRRRLDTELVRRGLARSREHAGELVGAGAVEVSGGVAEAGHQVDPAEPILVAPTDDDPGYASRGGHKLAGALDAFTGLSVADRQRAGRRREHRRLHRRAAAAGARRAVIAVDVGYGQLAWRLRQDPRVDGAGAHQRPRPRPRSRRRPAPDLVVADLSFISLRLVLPALLRLAAPGADLVLMVKPQFEVGRERLGAGGVVRDPQLRADAVHDVAMAGQGLGTGVRGVVASSLPGPSGNVEYFLLAAHRPRAAAGGRAAQPGAAGGRLSGRRRAGHMSEPTRRVLVLTHTGRAAALVAAEEIVRLLGEVGLQPVFPPDEIHHLSQATRSALVVADGADGLRLRRAGHRARRRRHDPARRRAGARQPACRCSG